MFTPGTALEQLIMRGPALNDPILKHLLILEAYDKTYGVNKRDDADRSTSMMSLSPTEDVVRYSTVEALINDIISCRLPELTNTPFLELAMMPRYRLDPLLEMGRKNRAREATAVENLEAEADKTAQEMSKPKK